MDVPPARKPDDSIIDRYMPNASMEERKEARENFDVFAAAILRIAERLTNEERNAAIRGNGATAVKSER